MTDVWSERAEAFRESAAHREGPDLDLVVEWCEPGDGVQALDVATGGGHVARRLREAGCEVVSVDPAPGMQPTIVAPAEQLPLADASFDVVACRIAPHHFGDVGAAMREMARVSRDRVVVEDNLFTSEDFEEAERLHDPTHVRCYSEEEWRKFFDEAGLEVEETKAFERWLDVEAWLARAETPEADAARVRELLDDRIEHGRVMFRSLVLKGRKR
ncbi:MAG: methyltransferase domain-containing protein [Actinomycetota bacterium]